MSLQHKDNDVLKPLFFDYGVDCDKQYNARASVVDYENEAKKYEQGSVQARVENVAVFDLQYGYGVDERLDIFPLPFEKSPAPVFVFIHGGYWRAQSKESACFMASALKEQGIALCTIEYTLMPETSLSEIVREVRAAIAWLYKHGTTYGLDTERIFVGGSSAGGHLASMLAAEGWQARYDLPENVIKGVLSISGLYEISPLCYTHINDWLRMHPDYTESVSPLWNLPRAGLPLHLVVGEFEPLGFKRQMEVYAKYCMDKGVKLSKETVKSKNHFDVVLELCDINSNMSKVLNLMVFS